MTALGRVIYHNGARIHADRAHLVGRKWPKHQIFGKVGVAVAAPPRVAIKNPRRRPDVAKLKVGALGTATLAAIIFGRVLAIHFIAVLTIPQTCRQPGAGSNSRCQGCHVAQEGLHCALLQTVLAFSNLLACFKFALASQHLNCTENRIW